MPIPADAPGSIPAERACAGPPRPAGRYRFPTESGQAG